MAQAGAWCQDAQQQAHRSIHRTAPDEVKAGPVPPWSIEARGNREKDNPGWVVQRGVTRVVAGRSGLMLYLLLLPLARRGKA